MRKKQLAILATAMILSLCTCACSNTTTETEGDTAMSTTVTTEQMTEQTTAETTANETMEETTQDTSKYASGIEVTEEETEENTERTSEEAAGLSAEISERCPINYSKTRSDVTYPKASHVTYYSTTCGMDRGVNILVPADYSEEKEYGVIYMLHGIFGDENSFANDSSNKIKEIVTNMAADGIIDEYIIVYPNMFAATDKNQKPSFNMEDMKPYDNFVNDLVTDLMPYVEANYSVKTGRENTILAGFSMGGRETLFIAHEHPELFGYVCAISPAPGLTPGTDFAGNHPGQLQEDEYVFAEDAILPDVFMVCCGTQDSVVGKFPLSYHEIMTRNGVDHTWYEVTGADHDNTAIQSGVYNLLNQMAVAKSQDNK